MSNPRPRAATTRRQRAVPSPRHSPDVERNAGAVTEGEPTDAAVDVPPARRESGTKDTVLVVMGVALLVTTPLATITVRRWWHWWNHLP